MHDIQEEQLSDGKLTFHFIPTTKFKTVSFVLKCKARLDKNTITNRALLSYVLGKGTVNYPTESLLMRRLDELYGAEYSADCTKKGNYHILTFRLEVANERFLPNEDSMSQKALQLLHEIIYKPFIEEGVFPEQLIHREKITLKNKISAIQDDKMAFANMRLIDEMCKDEVYRLHRNGYEEDLPNITSKSLYEYYQLMLQQDDMDLYVVGDVNTSELKEMAKDTFKHSTEKREITKVNNDSPEKIDAKEVVETQSIQQAKLHIGYRTNTLYQDEDYFALHVFNGIFGGFPSSKLFINVREKESLAYYAASRMESHKGLLIVYCGIEATDYQKTKDIIALQMKQMKQGKFEDEEITNVKELIISDIKETLDNPLGIMELLYQQVVGQQIRLPKDFIEGISQVTKEDVIRVAEKITLDTVYVLTNEKGATEHA